MSRFPKTCSKIYVKNGDWFTRFHHKDEDPLLFCGTSEVSYQSFEDPFTENLWLILTEINDDGNFVVRPELQPVLLLSQRIRLLHLSAANCIKLKSDMNRLSFVKKHLVSSRNTLQNRKAMKLIPETIARVVAPP